MLFIQVNQALGAYVLSDAKSLDCCSCVRALIYTGGYVATPCPIF